MKKICSIPYCGKPRVSNGFCNYHEHNRYVYGDPLYAGPRMIAAEAKRHAILNGKKTYFTGIPCKRGHIADRFFSGRCVECSKIVYRKRYLNDSAYRHKVRLASQNWVTKNPEKMRSAIRDWEKLNKHRKSLHRSNRRAIEILAKPKWADAEIMKDIYLEAQYQQMHVDHIIPLNNKYVCGLHWEWNLQLLTALDNKKKANKFKADGTAA